MCQGTRSRSDGSPGARDASGAFNVFVGNLLRDGDGVCGRARWRGRAIERVFQVGRSRPRVQQSLVRLSAAPSR